MLTSRTRGFQNKPLPGVQLNYLHPMSRGLVGCWLFNEGAGSVVNDASGKSKECALIDFDIPKSWVGSLKGGALNFDNTVSYLDVPNAVSIPAGSDFTFNAWLRPTAWLGGNPGLWRSGATSSGSTFNIFQGSTGLPWIRWNGADILKPTSGYSVSLNQLTLLTFVVVSGAISYFYADGNLKHTGSGAIPPAFTINRLGYQFSPNERVQGDYHYIHIYNRALSADEIKQLYHDPYSMFLRPSFAPWTHVAAVAAGIAPSAYIPTRQLSVKSRYM